MKSNLKQIFSSGGGTQSTAISALIVQGMLPKPDMCIIADTGREMPTTFEYFEFVTRPALEAVGVEVCVVKAMEWAANWGHPRNLFASNGDLLVPAFSSINNSKLTSFCSKAWKGESIDRWLSQSRGITRSKYVKWIGFSLDETNRVLRMQKGKKYNNGLIRFPLVSDVPTRRHEAIKIVENVGWPKPPRSRCWMCPNQSDYEWAEVKRDHPALWSEAVDLDNYIRTVDKHAFLHSSIAPLSLAKVEQEEDLFSGSCPNGECFL